ncbi:hypothetical protein BTVI_69135 [Pitangus sulphuratus]|nr:hypothetical protein BTVI_69135 [Pitangus sulphuratus]
MARCLTERCFSYDDPNLQFFALYWGLTSAYRAAVDYSLEVKAETETQTMAPETNAVPIRSTDIGIQTQLGVSVVSTESTETGTQTQPEANTASASPIETGTQTTTSEVKAMTEAETQTINSEITIAPVVKKKTWIREPAESAGPPL